ALHALGLAPAVGVDAEGRPRRVVPHLAGHHVVARLIPVGAPLPDVADHVVQAVGVGGERPDRGGALVAVLAAVLAGEAPLPDVGQPAAAGLQLVAPVVARPGPVEAAAGGVLPLSLGGQPLPGPLGVGDRVLPRHVDDGVLLAPFQVAPGAFGV